MKKFFLVCCMLLITGGFITGCFLGDDDGSAPAQITSAVDSPLISATVPVSAAVNVPLNRKLVITFSKALDPSTVNVTTVLVTASGGTRVAGMVDALITGALAQQQQEVALGCYAATFTPASNFTANTKYTVTLTGGVKYMTGEALPVNIVWSFTTGTALDTTAITASEVVPVDKLIDVAVNLKPLITFGEAMDPFTVNSDTFTLMGPGTLPVSGTVTYVLDTATFTPTNDLAHNTTYTATITTGVKDLAGNALVGNIVWTFKTSSILDTSAPTVTANGVYGTSGVLSGAVGQPVNKVGAVIFSEMMDPLTINKSTFTVKGPGAIAVAGTVTYVGSTATFMPVDNLADNTLYIVTITTGVKDLAGNALAAEYIWSFTTGSAPDTIAPTVISTDIYGTTGVTSGAVGLPLNEVSTVTFSEAMDPATININTFTLKGPGGVAVAGTVGYIGTTATFTPAVDLASNTLYTLTITTGAKDLSDNALAADYIWSYTTGAAQDVTAPTVISVTPFNNAVNVSTNGILTVIFDEAMDPLTMNIEVFTLKQGATAISGTIARTGNTVTFTPASSLMGNLQYSATISTGAKDLAGNALTAEYIWNFTTGTPIITILLPVNLGTAGNFAILAKSGIETVPTSAITGNIGISPAAATYITGFSLIADPTNVFSTATQVTGMIYAANYASPTPSNMTTAISDMEMAYTDAAGRTTPDFNELYFGDISGRTLAPGLYKWSTNVLINTDVTLNGGADDVWIFQASDGIMQSNGSRIILSGGAQAKNIFWQSFGQVTIGTTAHFEGIILCQTSIALNNGATINGRLFSQTAVTIKSSTVTQP